MALLNPISMLKKAQEQGYSIPAFNVHNFETVKAAVEVAYEEKLPVMI